MKKLKKVGLTQKKNWNKKSCFEGKKIEKNMLREIKHFSENFVAKRSVD